MEKKSFPLRTGKPRALGQDQGNVRQILLLSFDSLAVIFQIPVPPFFSFFVSVNTFPLSRQRRPLLSVISVSSLNGYG